MLSEAFSHDPFERRVRSTYAFVAEVLSALAEPAARVRAAQARPGPGGPNRAGALALRSRLTPSPRVGPVLAEDLARAPDSVPSEPGVPRGLRRTGRVRPVQLPIYDRFVPTDTVTLPAGGWAFAGDAPGAAQAVALLERHGIVVRHLVGQGPGPTQFVSTFRVQSLVTATRPFQGHREVRLAGTWHSRECRPAAGIYFVPSSQPPALLAAALLEPESDDGLATWNVWDMALRPGGEFPVVRWTSPIPVKEDSPPC